MPGWESGDSADGRGLRIIETVTTAWGFERHENGKVVWAELPMQGSNGYGAVAP